MMMLASSQSLLEEAGKVLCWCGDGGVGLVGVVIVWSGWCGDYGGGLDNDDNGVVVARMMVVVGGSLDNDGGGDWGLDDGGVRSPDVGGDRGLDDGGGERAWMMMVVGGGPG